MKSIRIRAICKDMNVKRKNDRSDVVLSYECDNKSNSIFIDGNIDNAFVLELLKEIVK